MTTTPDIVIHIGYYKTGTTFLQEEYFSHHPNLNFIGCSSTRYNPAELMRLIYSPAGTWTGQLNLPMSTQQTNVVSFESLSGGALWQGGEGMSIDNRTAQRLKEAFPHARIIVVVREQLNMLKSTYWQYIFEGGTRGYRDFLRHSLDDGNFFQACHLAYDALIKKYQELFGRENVLVLPFEQLVRERAGFLSMLDNFIGVPAFVPAASEHNRSPRSAFTFYYLRIVNFLFGGRPGRGVFIRFWTLFERLPLRQTYPLDDMIRSRLEEIYRASNRNTEIFSGVHLAQYGYLV